MRVQTGYQPGCLPSSSSYAGTPHQNICAIGSFISLLKLNILDGKTPLEAYPQYKKIFHNLQKINFPTSHFNAYCYNQKTILLYDSYDISKSKPKIIWCGISLQFPLIHRSDCCALQYYQNIFMYFRSTLTNPSRRVFRCSWHCQVM